MSKGPRTIWICDDCDYLVQEEFEGEYLPEKNIYSCTEVAICDRTGKVIREEEFVLDSGRNILTPLFCPYHTGEA